MPSKSELKALGVRRYYQDRALDARAVANLSSDEYLWFQTFFPARIEHAAQIENVKNHNKAAMKQVGAQQFWSKYWGTTNQAAPAEANRILGELQKFQASFPQFIVSRSENGVVLQWLRERHLELTYRNLVDSFEANALEGRLHLNPSAIGAGSESEVTGEALTRHHNFHLLIQPQQRMSETDRLSADEYLAQNSQLHDKRLPPIVISRNAKKEATEKFFEQARASTATARSGATKVTDYEREPRGGSGATSISEVQKASFRNLLNNLSAQEFAARCEDPQFKASVDRLGEK